MSGVGNKIIFENNEIKIWEFKIEPEEESPLHTHDMEYMFYVLEGSTLQIFDGNKKDLGNSILHSGDLIHYDIHDSELILRTNPSRKIPATHSAKNIGSHSYKEILMELKNSTTTDLKYSALHFQAINFLNQLFIEANKKGLTLKQYTCDHICYRVSSFEEYEAKKIELENLGTLLGESSVSNRKIATFKLFYPVYFNEQIIHIVELPQPKDNSYYSTGFEHAEFVIDRSFEDFVNEYPDLEFDFSGTKKSNNPELRLQLSVNTSIKFHHQTLENIIKIETIKNS